ncbi:MAG TPA: ArsC family reductase [Sphingobacteriaceae bacterium]
MKVYGIKNCDTVKKALTWLQNHNVEFEFHDFKKLGVSEEKLQEWGDKLGWEKLLNKKGTTWRKLDPAVQQAVNSEAEAFKLMQDKTSVIKRPVIEAGDRISIGFDEEQLRQLI